jgi:hypothetical protein
LVFAVDAFDYNERALGFARDLNARAADIPRNICAATSREYPDVDANPAVVWYSTKPSLIFLPTDRRNGATEWCESRS